MGPDVRQQKAEVSSEEVGLQPEAGASAWVDEATALCQLPGVSAGASSSITVNGP